MKLLMRRDQRSSFFGKTIFVLDIRAEFTPAEKDAIKKFKLTDTVLYQRFKTDGPPGEGFIGSMVDVARDIQNDIVCVRHLEGGYQIERKDVAELLLVEDAIKDAARNLKARLEVSSDFGGEEVIEL